MHEKRGDNGRCTSPERRKNGRPHHGGMKYMRQWEVGIFRMFNEEIQINGGKV